MTPEEKKKLMTPSGRPPVMFSEYRPYSPVVDLVPVSPPWPPPPWSAIIDEAPPRSVPSRRRAAARQAPPFTETAPTSELMTTGVPKLDSPAVQADGTLHLPWQQLIVNLWRLAQPTGVAPGTFAGLTINANGQVIAATSQNVSFESASFNDVVLTGHGVAPTPPTSDNSTTIATTAYVQNQGYATIIFVTSQGYATQTFVLSQGFLTEASALSHGFIQDAPQDGNIYGRQNGAWVVVTAVPPEGLTEGAGD